MQRDYYAFRRMELDGSLDGLEQAAKALEGAKQHKDKNVRSQAEKQMKQAAEKAVKTEPHLAYLWFWAKKEQAERRNSSDEVKRASEIANSIRDAWQKQNQNKNKKKIEATLEDFHLTPDSSVIPYLPPLSFMLRIPFQLEKPYLSKDDRLFHILDNPVRKEWLFHVPMVAASSWKGVLRAALWQLGYKEGHKVTIRLLGNPRESEEQQAGRLHFFPTFFNELGLEVINPHDRESGVGAQGPILMECVPQEAKGELFLLYVPFGVSEHAAAEKRQEVAEDLEVLAQGIKAMLTTYGFGTKTSSGFGIAKEHQKRSTALSIESRGGQYGKKDKQLYDKAKSWWEREGRALAEAWSQEPEAEAEPKPPEPPPVTEYTCDALSRLWEVTRRIAEELRKGG